MPILALALCCAFYLLVFVVRDALHRRRTGASGVRWTGPASTRAERTVQCLFLLSVLLGPVSTLGQAFGWVRPLWTVGGWAAGVALAVWALGAAATFLSQGAMGASWRIGQDADERTDLVRSGVFTLVRNPIYASLFVTCLAMGSLVPNVLTLLLLALTAAAIEIQVRCVEEPHLSRTHGEAFARYAASTGRFVPGLGRLARPPG